MHKQLRLETITTNLGHAYSQDSNMYWFSCSQMISDLPLRGFLMFNTTLSQMRPKKNKKQKEGTYKNAWKQNWWLTHSCNYAMAYVIKWFICLIKLECTIFIVPAIVSLPLPPPFSLSLFQLITFSLYFDLILQYSVFSSLLTLGATISGVTSGRTTDLIGPRGVSIMTLQLAPGLL